MEEPVAILIGAAVAAAVALMTSLIYSWITFDNQKKQLAVKAAEFRQAWINRLREALADFSSAVLSEELTVEKRDALNRAAANVYLMMNPRDKNYEKLRNAMNSLINERRTQSGDFNQELMIKYRDVSQEILKSEWDRLKRDLKEGRV